MNECMGDKVLTTRILHSLPITFRKLVDSSVHFVLRLSKLIAIFHMWYSYPYSVFFYRLLALAKIC